MSGGSALRRGVFTRIALPGNDNSPPTGEVLRVWLGFGGIDVPTTALDVGEEEYHGLGAVAGIPALENAINGKSSRAEFSLSGVSAAVANLADAEEADVRGANVNVGVCKFDEDWQIDGDLFFLWDGVADVLSTSMGPDELGNQTYAIRLSVGTAPAGRSRAENATWSDAQHQARRPGDLFFNQVPPPEATERWPGG